ncbi:hypothetical protein AWB67_06266 [Caballeronia terrestris]|uniref:Uncharacterized protein n=1 Tax=Caballeronia terrestris TaxID=1226301 RepID=A0A158KQD1_9BURK|nr:ATP-grasp fold amidoligase family protein [Caballeronia terrestris]SAL82933.1 hypothetical protein AWB67_06266 [Caballeronia terrestris]
MFISAEYEIGVRMSLLKEIKRFLKDLLPDPLFLYLSHRRRIGRFPRLKYPVTFNEKILYRCLYPDPGFAALTDKLLVRDYVQRRIGKEHLIPVLLQPDNFTWEQFAALPAAFVMKANHGSGYVKIVHDKSQTSFEELSKLANEWLGSNFYRVARERHYERIKPRIFFELLLTDSHGNVPADFKIHCFNRGCGRQQAYILLISDRFTPHPRGDFYDEDWNHLDIRIGHYPRSVVPAPRPLQLELLLRKAKALAADFDYVRVDMYAPDNQIYFGELTFTPGAGVYRLTPDVIDYDWGRLLQPCPSAAGIPEARAGVAR